VKILFALLQSKKIATKSTLERPKTDINNRTQVINRGTNTSQTFRTSSIILNCDEGEYSEKVTNEQITKVLKIGMRTIEKVKKKLLMEGFILY